MKKTIFVLYKIQNLYSLKMKNSSIREKIEVREISKDVFCKFKKVRDLQSHLYGSYQLYSKNGLKYIGKQLKENFQLLSTRSPNYPIFKYNNSDSSIFLFSLHGEPIVNLLSKSQAQGQIKGWIQKCGSIQMVLFDVLKKMLRVLQIQGEIQIILQCLRVYNGQLQYCYDNWMESSYQIVINHPKQLENYYFSKQDLANIKQYNENGTFNTPSKMTYIFRVFLLILHLGTYNIKERNYQFDGMELHYQHLQTRLEHFCGKYNQKGLGSLVKKVILGQSIAMEELWKFSNPEISKSNKGRKILSISNVNAAKPKTKNITDNSDCSQQTPIKNSQINKLNISIFSHQSNKSKKQQQNQSEIGKYSQYKFSSSNCENWSQVSQTKTPLSRSLASENISKGKKITKLINNCKKDKYQLFSNNYPRQSLNIKSILQQLTEIPYNVKFLSYFGLQEYLPQNIYQQQVLQLLFSIHIKSSWVKQTYDNGSIYLGDIASGKKEGKGLYLFNSNDLYFGDWQKNCMDGYGTYIFITGEVYQGQLKKGFKEGHGKCIYPDGKSYEGFWSKNCKVGLGKVKFPNQVIFIGLFHANTNQTQGIFIGPIGQEGKPLWENKGVLQHYHWQDNVLVDKKVKNEDLIERKQKLKHCKTQYYSTHIDDYHNSFEGQMINGKKHGFGIYESPSETYEGQWLDDKKNGLGTLYIKNSFHISGQWKNNILIKYISQQIDQPL